MQPAQRLPVLWLPGRTNSSTPRVIRSAPTYAAGSSRLRRYPGRLRDTLETNHRAALRGRRGFPVAAIRRHNTTFYLPGRAKKEKNVQEQLLSTVRTGLYAAH